MILAARRLVEAGITRVSWIGKAAVAALPALPMRPCSASREDKPQ